MRERARTLLVYAPAAGVLAWCWLRLERPHVGAAEALWLIVLAVAPVVLPRRPLRLAGTAIAAALALHSAFGVWITHPGRLLGHFGSGFVEFYDVRMPFAAAPHPWMEGVILVALFASCSVLAWLIAERRPLGASFALLAGAGWPATLLSAPDDRRRGLALLVAILVIVVGLGGSSRLRRLGFAALAGAAAVAVAFGLSSSRAVASGQVLHWQSWDFYNKPQQPVGVEYVWHSDYRGLRFPKKVTTVLRIKAPDQPMYWRATTLDEFDGANWFESEVPITPNPGDGREILNSDEEFPPGAADSSRWVREDVTVAALRDNHLVAGSAPVAYGLASSVGSVDYAAGGLAFLPDHQLSAGDRYSAWSYQAKPKPEQLARLAPRYPTLVLANDLAIDAHTVAPAFAAPGREATLQRAIRDDPVVRRYGRFYAIAKRVVGRPASPYAGALELEAWFRSTAFRYDQSPPQIASLPPLVAFVTRTRAGYCQHFAGAMALMLRYLGIPARVAAGFTSGAYDAKSGEWIVTDHDAHTWVEAWFPHYGWLPFDPTPGRGNLVGPYTASSLHFDLSDGLRAVGASLRGSSGGFALRNLKHGAASTETPATRKLGFRKSSHSGGGSGLGALLKLLALVVAGSVVFVAALKLCLRKRRYLTRDPRRRAGASVRELRDFLVDQGVETPASATLPELSAVVYREFGVHADDFAVAAARARFGPIASADRARAAHRELRRLLRELRHGLSRSERARGVLSLRSLGLVG